MITINVLLSGRLKLDGYGRGKPENNDDTFSLTLLYIFVPEQLLDGPDIVSSLKQVSGKAIAEGMWADIFVNSCLLFRSIGLLLRQGNGKINFSVSGSMVALVKVFHRLELGSQR